MPANTSPIFTAVPNIGIPGAVVGPTANTSLDGSSSSTSASLIFTAGSNGSLVSAVILKAVGSPATTVGRIFYCSSTSSWTAGTTNTSSNSTLIAEVTLPTVTLTQTGSSPQYQIDLSFPLPPSTKLFITFGTSTGASGTGYAVTAVGGDY